MKYDLEQIRQKFNAEYDAFSETMNEWVKLKEQAFQLKKQAVSDRIGNLEQGLKVELSQIEARVRAHGKNLEAAFNGFSLLKS
jgi:stearoyl-CoA desaturase (delta-9 desaturase)